MKFNLGCGAKPIKGYINIDAAEGEYANPDMKADLYCDILDLQYEPNTIEVVRMESVYEHFPRHIAIFLTRRFYTWLQPGGFVTITVPDLMGIIQRIQKYKTVEDQLFYFRCVFGPQAHPQYGTHYDGFTIEKLEHTFKAVGFNRFQSKKYGKWPSIRFTAFKDEPFMPDKQAEENIHKILRLYARGVRGYHLFDSWIQQWKELEERKGPE